MIPSSEGLFVKYRSKLFENVIDKRVEIPVY